MLPLNFNSPDYYGDWKSELANIVSDIKLTDVQLKSGIIGERYRWREVFYAQIDSRFSNISMIF